MQKDLNFWGPRKCGHEVNASTQHRFVVVALITLHPHGQPFLSSSSLPSLAPPPSCHPRARFTIAFSSQFPSFAVALLGHSTSNHLSRFVSSPSCSGPCCGRIRNCLVDFRPSPELYSRFSRASRAATRGFSSRDSHLNTTIQLWE